MKKIIPVALLFITAVLMVSCKDESPENFTKNLAAFNWRVTDFVKDARQAEKEYAAYSFTFTTVHDIVARKGTDTYNGDWTIYTGAVTDDVPVETDFVINFKDDKELSGLNGKWVVTDYTDTGFRLSRLKGSKNLTEYLTFGKI